MLDGAVTEYVTAYVTEQCDQICDNARDVARQSFGVQTQANNAGVWPIVRLQAT